MMDSQTSQNNRAFRSNPNEINLNDLFECADNLLSQNNRAFRSNPNKKIWRWKWDRNWMSQNNRAFRSNPNMIFSGRQNLPKKVTK